jgi:HSP90 family molecular chaperone
MVKIPLNVDLPRFITVLRSLFQAEHVYLRELVQNSLEATHQAALHGAPPRPIRITTDADARTLTVTDYGIGMTQEEMRNNLTRLFSSGWPTLEGGTLGIGEFGFGFFSTFLVASEVEVISRSYLAPNTAHRWVLNISEPGPRLTSLKTLPQIGTSVKLRLEPSYRYIIDEELISAELLNHYLYTPYPIHVDDVPLSTSTPDGWRNRLSSETGPTEMGEWLTQRYGWEDSPILVAPFQIDNGGWLAVVPEGEHAPAFEVYRRGILITSQELIPEPYNLFITGLVDMHNLSVKPDRETLYRNENYNRLIRALTSEVRNLASSAAKITRDSSRNIFARHFNAITLAMERDSSLRQEIGMDLPVPLYSSDPQRRTSQPLREVLDEEERKCLYWSDDRTRDSIFADRLQHLDKMPVFLGDAQIRKLVLMICREQRIPTYTLADSYAAHLRNDSSSLSEFPQLEYLFEKTLGVEWSVLTARDVDSRFPLRLIPRLSRAANTSLFDLNLAVINSNNAIIRAFAMQLPMISDAEALKFISAICALAKLVAEPEDMVHQFELANKYLLALYESTDESNSESPDDQTMQSPLSILYSRYADLLAACRATVAAYKENESNPIWYLLDELRFHPVDFDSEEQEPYS